MINFKLRGEENGVSLCKTCHDQYDNKDPGYIFYPADLQFFVDFEKKDKAQRADISQRKVPKAEDYLEHCIQKGLVPHDAAGGLYRRIFIQGYLHVGTPICKMISEKYGTPVVWPGAPMAPLIRALRTESALVDPALFPDKLKLVELCMLYFSELRPLGLDGACGSMEEDPLAFGPEYSTNDIINDLFPGSLNMRHMCR